MKGNAIEPFENEFIKLSEAEIESNVVAHTYDIILLLNKMDNLKEIYHEERYIHECSIRNFLFYFDHVRTDTERQFIYSSLYEFLSKLEVKHFSSPADVATLYRLYLEPVGKFYSTAFKFKVAKRKHYSLFIFKSHNKKNKRKFGLFY